MAAGAISRAGDLRTGRSKLASSKIVMATVQEDILKAFYAKLTKSKEFDDGTINAVRKLLDSGKKFKPEDLVTVLAKGKDEGGLIQIQAVTIRELRGIRELTLHPNGKNFVVSGPNGSGKSGVVDAIQFGLTGDISRLSGKGTVGLTVQRHGPHVDKRDDPEAAEVSLTMFVPETGKTVVLTRNVKTAKTFTPTPDDPKTKAVVEEVALHPELTLSRREIIKYILVEAGERSKEIQALLKLDDVGQIRSALQTTKNKLSSAHTAAQRDLTNAEDALRRHLDINKLSGEDILAAVNPRRKLLGLAEIAEKTADTALNEGVLDSGSQPAFNKQSALRDIGALADAAPGFPSLAKTEVSALLKDISTLESDPALLQAVT